MGLFRSTAHAPMATCRVTVTGKPHTHPETIGDVFPRRVRLAGAAVALLSAHPLASQDLRGQPLGDGTGMEDAVDALRPLLTRERALSRWVALRGSFLYADMAFGEQGNLEVALASMGMAAGPRPGIIGVSTGRGLSNSQVASAEGLVNSVMLRLRRYGELEEMSVDAVAADTQMAAVNEAIALDYICWVSIALLRSGLADLLPAVPEPGRIEEPGWYPEPLFAKAERFHDGSDWTASCRLLTGRRAEYAEMALG